MHGNQGQSKITKMPLSLTQNKLLLERSGRTRGDSRPPVPGAVALAAAVFFLSIPLLKADVGQDHIFFETNFEH
jgi:hypothetical protein